VGGGGRDKAKGEDPEIERHQPLGCVKERGSKKSIKRVRKRGG